MSITCTWRVETRGKEPLKNAPQNHKVRKSAESINAINTLEVGSNTLEIEITR